MTDLQDQRTKQIRTLAQQTGGIVTTSQIESLGINRVAIPSFVEAGILTKESHGIYCYADEFPDDMQRLQLRSPKLIYSYGTALYLWDMSDRTPHIWDITVPQGYNASRIKKNTPNIRLHYVSADKWDVGITEAKTSNGSLVRLYDKERCIVDLVRRKNRIDKQLYLQALKEYFSDKNADRIKLLKYAKLFHIEAPVRVYMDILSD